MQNVFDAGTNVEAHMVANLLQHHGIDTQVLGGHLQSAVGEIGPFGNIRVMVDETDVTEARRIIREWEQTPVEYEPEPEPEKVAGRTGKSLGVLPFILGVISAAAAFFWYSASPYSENTADYNEDGKIDDWFYYSRQRLLRIETDRNGDGEVDAVAKFSILNVIESNRFDNDFDGSFEELTAYRNNQPVFTEIDLDSDLQPDMRYTYVNGVFTQLEFYRPGTRTVRKVNFYKQGNLLTESHWDSDDDGVLDTLITYGPFEEEVSRRALNSQQ